MKLSRIELDSLDAACVPAGFFLLIFYHVQLSYRVWKFPNTTVIGTNRLYRQAWIKYTTKDPVKNCAVAVQAFRNSLMAAAVLATASITLSMIISGIISRNNSSASMGSSTGEPITSSSELFSVLACFLTSFFCNLQALRYGCYVGYLACAPLSDDATLGQTPSYVYQSFEKACMFWSLGLRSFYISVPLLMWLFGPVSMLLSSLAMVIALHFLDTITTSPKKNMARLDSIQVKLMDQEKSKVEP